MRNAMIKFCDENKINDGVLRESLIHGNTEDSINSVNEAMRRTADKLKALTALKKKLEFKKRVEDFYGRKLED